MSNPQAKKERSKAKDSRQSPASDAPSTSAKKSVKKTRKSHPWVVEERAVPGTCAGKSLDFWKDWVRVGRYRTEKEALVGLQAHQSKLHALCQFEYRHRNLLQNPPT